MCPIKTKLRNHLYSIIGLWDLAVTLTTHLEWVMRKQSRVISHQYGPPHLENKKLHWLTNCSAQGKVFKICKQCDQATWPRLPTWLLPPPNIFHPVLRIFYFLLANTDTFSQLVVYRSTEVLCFLAIKSLTKQMYTHPTGHSNLAQTLSSWCCN